MSQFDYTPDESTSWRKGALCANWGFEVPDMYPNELHHEAVREAKRFCQMCPVRSECLAEALDRSERYGIWGGMDFRERSALRRSKIRPSRAASVVAVPVTANDVDATALDAAGMVLEGIGERLDGAA